MTGAARHDGIGYAIATRLARDGWDVAITFWRPFDLALPWRAATLDPEGLKIAITELGRRIALVEADLADPAAPASIFDTVEAELGPVSALVNAHTHHRDSGLDDTTVEDFDRHMAVNARAVMLLTREFAQRYRGERGLGRIINLTSDAVHNNLPYGASKAAIDVITAAAAGELGPNGITVNAINPGPNDTGWMSDALKADVRANTPLGRIGTPQDTANLVSFLCSPEGGWITGQLLYSNGGIKMTL